MTRIDSASTARSARLRSRPFAPRTLWAGAAIAVALVAGGAVAAASVDNRDPAASAPVESPASDATSGSAGAFQDPAVREGMSAREEATATRVEIPSIGVDSTLEQLPLDESTGELTPPVDFDLAGWYRDGTVPGDVGPAVIAGHVDSVTAPAVFARLDELVAGDEIRVTLSDGTLTTFAVDSTTGTPKDAFPTDLVYGPTPTAQLRLITCDGDFDGATGHYLDNLIVFASLEA